MTSFVGPTVLLNRSFELQIIQYREVRFFSETYRDFLEGYVWRQPANEDLAARLPWSVRGSRPAAVVALPSWRWPLSLCPENCPFGSTISVYPTVVPSLRHCRHKQEWSIEVGLFRIRKEQVRSQIGIPSWGVTEMCSCSNKNTRVKGRDKRKGTTLDSSIRLNCLQRCPARAQMG
jgi:hypothetical protein